VKQRLVRAYASHLEDLAEMDFQVESGNALAGLHRALHGVAPVGRETAVQASVQKMSSNEAAGHAAVILGLYRELVTTERRGEHLKIVDSGPAEEELPPQFLVGSH